MRIGIDIGLSSGRGGGFKPSQISGLDLWLRADLGFSVSLWADQSGLGHNLAQATGTKQFTFSASGGPLGTSIVTGDAVDDFMRGTWTANQPLDTWIVCKFGSGAANATVVDGSVFNSHRLYIPSTPTTIGIYSAATGPLTDTPSDVTANWHCYHGVYNGASSSLTVDDRTTITGTLGATAAGGIILNIGGDTAFAPAGASLAEVIRYSRALSASEAAQVRSYLKARYGV